VSGARLARLDRALERVGCDAYLGGSAIDARYFAGSEDRSSMVLYTPGGRPVVVTHPMGYDHAGDTAVEAEVLAFRLVDGGPGDLLARLIAARGVRRLAVAGLPRPLEEALRARLEGVRLEDGAEISPTIRRRKEPVELEHLRRAAAIGDAATQRGLGAIRPGVSELEVAGLIEAEGRRCGIAGAMSITHVMCGPRAAYPDSGASERPIGRGELGFVDIGLFYRGYKGDMSRAFAVGDLHPELHRLLETVDRVQRMAVGMVRPGAGCRDLFLAVEEAFAEAGYPGCPPHHLGHALGLGNDRPTLLPTSHERLEEGDVVTVEPGAYVHGLGGARIEDAVIVRAGGPEVLSGTARVTRVPA
jgi:Xaa-Pro aminopeptidase